MSMTYTTLKEIIAAYLQRDDLVEKIPVFIKLAEDALSEILDNHLGLVRYVTGPFQIGQSVLQKPARWRRTISFHIGTGDLFNTHEILKDVTYEYATNYNKNRDNKSQPVYFSDYGWNNWFISPSPDLPYPYEIGYIETVENLSESVQTNWLTNYASRALLYGSLLEASPYLKDDERIQVWETRYEKTIQVLKQQDIRRYTTRQTDRESD